MNGVRSKSIEGLVIRGMDRHELTLEVRRKLGYFEAARRSNSPDFIAVCLAVSGLFEIEKAGVPRRNLHAFVAERRGPPGNVFQIIEGRTIARKLREKNCRTFDGFHGIKISG